MDSPELALPLELKEKGNKFFVANRLAEAGQSYAQSLSALQDVSDNAAADALRCTLLSNSAMVALKQKV